MKALPKERSRKRKFKARRREPVPDVVARDLAYLELTEDDVDVVTLDAFYYQKSKAFVFLRGSVRLLGTWDIPHA